MPSRHHGHRTGRHPSNTLQVPFELLEQRFACAVVSGLEHVLAAVPVAVLRPAAAASAVTVPTAVTGIAAVRGDHQVTLSWKAPANTGGSAIKTYTIQYTVNTAGKWSAWQTVPRADSTAVQAVVTGLTNGRLHLFRVAAVNAVGTGPFAQLATPTTPAGGPQAPGGPTATPSTGSVALQWTAPADSGGLTVTNYNIQLRKNASGSWGPWIDLPRAASAATAATLGGLENGIMHEFRVRAVTAVGPGTWSTTAWAVPTYFLPGLVPPSGWVHRNGMYSSYFLPTDKWQAVDTQHGLSISSPTGTIGVNYLGSATSGNPMTPRQVVDMEMQAGVGIVSYQVTHVGTPLVSGNVTSQEFELTATLSGPNGNFSVRSAYLVRTYVDPWTYASGYESYTMVARTDLWAAALGTMQTIRTNMRRISGFG